MNLESFSVELVSGFRELRVSVCGPESSSSVVSKSPMEDRNSGPTIRFEHFSLEVSDLKVMWTSSRLWMSSVGLEFC